jgi:hypothetical protein
VLTVGLTPRPFAWTRRADRPIACCDGPIRSRGAESRDLKDSRRVQTSYGRQAAVAPCVPSVCGSAVVRGDLSPLGQADHPC